MTTGQIGQALMHAAALEAAARAHWQAAPTLAERDAALAIVRQVTPVIRSLEQWIAARAVRAAQ